MTNNLVSAIKALMEKYSIASMIEQLTIVQAIDSNNDEIKANATTIAALEAEIEVLEASLPIYVYKAVITQAGAGTAPTASILINTFPSATWSYNSVGVYSVDLGVDLSDFLVNTIQGCVSDTGMAGGLLGYVYGEPAVSYVISTVNDALTAADDILVNYTLVIEAYKPA